MRYLVDTHVFLWWMSDPDRLSPGVVSLLRDQSQEIGFSSVSVWEIAIKSALGKVSGVPLEELEAEVGALGWSELRFTIHHAAAVAGLPFHHHDPFDRALIAQCVAENLAFVTADRAASQYPVNVFW